MADKVKVMSNRATIHTVRTKGGAIRFLPGINRITPEEWKACKAHPVTQRRIFSGQLALVGEESKAKPPTAAELAAEAKETFDMVRLQELAADERKTVREAAEAQIAAIEAKAGDGKGEGDDEGKGEGE